MDGTLGDDIEDRDELVRHVHSELVALRGQIGRLTVQKFGEFLALRRVCGGGDLLDAFLMFEREMTRYKTSAGRNEAAAAISITAPAETVLDRLEHAVGALPQDGRLRDQRTARRWSDAGLTAIARDLVYMAEVQGRLGTELLSIDIQGDLGAGLTLTIDQMTSTGLSERAPLFRLWHYKDDDQPEERALTVDLEDHASTVVDNGVYRMRRHHLQAQLPLDWQARHDDAKILSISIEGRDAPMRTVTITDRSAFPKHVVVESTVYRTIAMIDVIAHPSETK